MIRSGNFYLTIYTHAFRLWIWIVGCTIRCSLSLWTMPQSIISYSRHSFPRLYSPKRKVLCLATSHRDTISIFQFSGKQKSRYTTSRITGVSSQFNFSMLCNGFEIQNHAAYCPPKRAALFRRRSVLYPLN